MKHDFGWIPEHAKDRAIGIIERAAQDLDLIAEDELLSKEERDAAKQHAVEAWEFLHDLKMLLEKERGR